MKRNNILIITLIIGFIILIILNSMTYKDAVEKCVEGGNAVGYCEARL